ncbi:hypothetical protein [Polyangium aurulentum]|uniref:hypothetical protein n=1 Tax=Polyangium aurulentum TaxID=2567896 RepID=UPI0010AE0DA3|nr:hypothetical protein [Polyangium aurulentum]UQA61982.1 hypothetical protein E8A73_016510 [Polyangium aurulentum]
MGRPSYDEQTLAAYFQPIQAETWNDPVAGPALRCLAVEDPDIIAAVADVDRSQIRDCLSRTPWERLQRAMGMARVYAGFRRVDS